MILSSLVLLLMAFIDEGWGEGRLKRLQGLHVSQTKLRFDESCDFVCLDLPKNDDQPVCMMFSRYKKYYQFFVNECQARRAICKENLLLHLVHVSRCLNGNQYYMPVN